jgi:hypothetical protein
MSALFRGVLRVATVVLLGLALAGSVVHLHRHAPSPACPDQPQTPATLTFIRPLPPEDRFTVAGFGGDP